MSLFKEIGGFLDLTFRDKSFIYKNVLFVNSARNAFELILKEKRCTKIFLPFYTCDVLIQVLQRNHIDFEQYHINSDFEIDSLPILGENEYLVYTNYFGLKSEYAEKLSSSLDRLIIDNAQAFFCKPIIDVLTFYSPRKYFGLPDGGIVSGLKLTEELEYDISFQNLNHLLMRSDLGAASAYSAYCQNEEIVMNKPLRLMSHLTKSLLFQIDFEWVRKRREENFNYLNNELEVYNRFKWSNNKFAPISYPLLLNTTGISTALIKRGIFVPTYWPKIENNLLSEFELSLVKNVVHLPIDQRYGAEEMDFICRNVKSLIK